MSSRDINYLIVQNAAEKAPFPNHEIDERNDGVVHQYRYDARIQHIVKGRSCKRVLIIMLNPGAIAPVSELMHSVRKAFMIGYNNGYNYITVMNLYSIVSKDSKKLKEILIDYKHDAKFLDCMAKNRQNISDEMNKCDAVVYAWGCGNWKESDWVLLKAKQLKIPELCIGQNKKNRPFHPSSRRGISFKSILRKFVVPEPVEFKLGESVQLNYKPKTLLKYSDVVKWVVTKVKEKSRIVTGLDNDGREICCKRCNLKDLIAIKT